MNQINSANPYNCTKPGNLYFGHSELRFDVLDGFRNGHSFAILGGRRCGKSSTLLQLHKDIRERLLTPFCMLPFYMDFQELCDTSPAAIFRKILMLVAPPEAGVVWNPPIVGAEYEYFLEQITPVAAVMRQKHGAHWLVILLLDEIDRLGTNRGNDQFFHNLRNFLTVSRHAMHFRVVASGSSGLNALTLSGSPLNNLRYKHLCILDHGACRELILAGFSERWANQNFPQVEQATGRHPYFMQGVLEKLWAGSIDCCASQDFERLCRQFLREHRDLESMLKSFHTGEHAVYRYLIQHAGDCITLERLRRELPADMTHLINDAVNVLAYHGVVDDNDPRGVRLAGTLFQSWYQANVCWKPAAQRTESARQTIHQHFMSVGHMGDRYENKGQAAVVGPHALVQNVKFDQFWDQRKADIDLSNLVKELVILRAELAREATTQDQLSELSTLVAAEKGAREGDGPKMLAALSKLGKWSLTVSEKIGVDLATAAIKQAIGI